MARAPILQLTDISLTFGGNPVFDGLNMTIQPGDRVALVGRNGSGKSTLMKVMAGLVEPDAGQVVTGGLITNRIMTKDQARTLRQHNRVAEGAMTFADLGIEPISALALLDTYLWRFRPSGQYEAITASAKPDPSRVSVTARSKRKPATPSATHRRIASRTRRSTIGWVIRPCCPSQ